MQPWQITKKLVLGRVRAIPPADMRSARSEASYICFTEMIGRVVIAKYCGAIAKLGEFGAYRLDAGCPATVEIRGGECPDWRIVRIEAKDVISPDAADFGGTFAGYDFAAEERFRIGPDCPLDVRDSRDTSDGYVALCVALADIKLVVGDVEFSNYDGRVRRRENLLLRFLELEQETADAMRLQTQFNLIDQ